MCIKHIASLFIVDVMARLTLLFCVFYVWRYSTCEQGQLHSNNDLFAIGNGADGYGKLLVASPLTNTISLDSYSVSSACGSHPSRCRELLIEAIETSNFTSKHVMLVPLENGVQILELVYNGTSSNQLRLVAQHSLLFHTVNGNHSCGSSLGVHKIGSDYFTPCIGTDDHYYVCQITLNLTAITQSTLQPCRQVNISLSNVETRVHPSSISNIVVTNKSLIFLIWNVLYELYPRSSSNTPFTNTFPTYCSLVSQLLISPQHKNQLLIYCRNQNTIVYDLNLHSITRTEGTSNIPYPCSPTAEYIVHLSQTRMEFSYKLNSDGDTVIRIFKSPSSSVNYYSGVCFESTRGNHLFIYVDTSVGAYLFNATSENLWPIPNTLGCSQSECELPLVYGNRYIVIRNKLRRNVTVFDALFNRSIINLGDVQIPLQLVTFISDLPAISLQNVPPISTIVYKDSSNQSQDSKKGGVPLEVVVPVAILSILIVIILIAIIVIVVILIKKRCCSSRVDSGKYELDVKFAKQNHEVVIENHSIPESQPIKIVAAELETNDSSYSNPTYSGESFNDHKEMPATVIVFENQVTSDPSPVDHDVGIQYPQDNSREQTVTDLSNSETQYLIEPIKAGRENDNLNVTASLEDNNPPSDDHEEVIVNIHALNNSLDDPKVDSQPESQCVPSTNQLIESGESPPPVNPQFTTEREEQTAGNGASSKLSTSADQALENGGQINDDTKERESEEDVTLKNKSIEHTETWDPPPPLNMHPQLSAGREDQTVDTVTPSELSPSSDQHFEGGGSVNKNRKSEGDRSENSIEHTETGDPPPQCMQLNAEREDQTVDTGMPSELSLSPDQKFEGEGRDVRECEEDTSANSIGHTEIGDPPPFPSNIIRGEQFESGGSINDDNEDRENDEERSDKLQPSKETTSELPVALNGEEKQASSESLSSTDHDDAAHISDINGGESGNEDREDNYGQERQNSPNLMMKMSLGSSSDMESSVLESNVPTEKAQSHNINQYQECTHIDSVLPENLPESATAPASIVKFPSLEEDFSNSMDKEKDCMNTESENPPEHEVISPSTDKLLGHTSETAVEDMDSVISQPSLHQERTDSNPINQEKEEHCEEENISQSCKSDFEAPVRELECIVDQEDTENCLKPGEANRNDKFEAPPKELKNVIDQEHTGDNLETEAVNGDENNKHDFEASAEKLECAMDKDLGEHFETEKVNGDKRDDSKQGDCLETEEVNGDDDGNAFSKSPDSLSVVADQDNIENQSRVSVNAANEKHAPAHLGSLANSEESLISSSIKSTSRQSDDDEVLPSKSPASTESNLDMSLSSQEDACREKDKACNGNVGVNKPTDLDESQSSQDDICKEREEAHNNSMEADKLDTVNINQEGEHNNTEAKTDAESAASNELLVPVESQKEVLMEVAPIKCTFVGRTVKTVVRTSTGDTTSDSITNLQNYESFTVTDLPKTDTAASEENIIIPNDDSAKKIEPTESGDLSLVRINGAFLTSHDDSMIPVANQDMQKIEHIGSDTLSKQEQRFPYKYETVI